MQEVTINKQARLSQHFTLGELCKTSAKTADGNIPSHVHIENLKRLCGWLEMLRKRYNERYVMNRRDPSATLGMTKGVLSSRLSKAHGEISEEPIVINSGYRSPAVNKAVGGVATSNHLTGCAADIRVTGMEQLIRYAAILLDYADETGEEFDELLLEKNRSGAFWLHFAVKPKGNRHKVLFISV
jgi:hypothetical protein